MTNEEIIEVVRAHSEGKRIEWCYKYEGGQSEWKDALPPIWDFNNLRYRVKPEPPKPREFWINIYTEPFNAGRFHPAHESKDSANNMGGFHHRKELIHVREVLE